jgi:hypothetical protein
MKEPGVLSLNVALEKGVAVVHVHPRAENNDEALKTVVDEFFRQMPPAPGQSLRPIQVPGAESAFAITLRSTVMGTEIAVELRAARRDGDLAVWAAMGAPETEPARRFLASFAFTERGEYADPIHGFRVAIPPGWEHAPYDDTAIVLQRGHRPTQQVLYVRRLALRVDNETLDHVAEQIARVTVDARARQIALRKQLLAGRKTVDIWWQETDAGRSFVSGMRCIVFPDRTLTITVVSADTAEPTPTAERMLESFQPLAASVLP